MVEDHCLQAMNIVHYYANGCFDWLISGQQSDNPLREAISVLSGKYKRFTFVHPVNRFDKSEINEVRTEWTLKRIQGVRMKQKPN